MPSFTDCAPNFNFQDLMPKFKVPTYDYSLIAPKLFAGQYGSAEPPLPPEPLSIEQVDEKVANHRAKLEARWESCKDYLAATAWPGLKFRIHNAARDSLRTCRCPPTPKDKR